MKAIILAAGYGTRIRPLSNYVPKPLMPIVGQPLLRHIIMKLKACKADGIGINTHHNADMIKAFISCETSGVPVALSHEQVILGSGGGIGGFRDFLQDADFFIVHNGDVLSNIALGPAIAHYAKDRPLCALILHDRPPHNNVIIDENNAIVDMRDVLKPGQVFKRLAYTGIAIMDKRMVAYIPPGVSDIVDILLKIIQQGKQQVQGIVIKDAAWEDIGTVKSYFEAHRAILLNRTPLIEEIPGRGGSFYFGEGTVREDGTELKGFVSAGRNCVLKKGCRMENCIIWDNVTIAEHAVFKNAIIGNGWVVDPYSLLS